MSSWPPRLPRRIPTRPYGEFPVHNIYTDRPATKEDWTLHGPVKITVPEVVCPGFVHEGNRAIPIQSIYEDPVEEHDTKSTSDSIAE